MPKTTPSAKERLCLKNPKVGNYNRDQLAALQAFQTAVSKFISYRGPVKSAIRRKA